MALAKQTHFFWPLASTDLNKSKENAYSWPRQAHARKTFSAEQTHFRRGFSAL
jgi:hypothetical protein